MKVKLKRWFPGADMMKARVGVRDGLAPELPAWAASSVLAVPPAARERTTSRQYRAGTRRTKRMARHA